MDYQVLGVALIFNNREKKILTIAKKKGKWRKLPFSAFLAVEDSCRQQIIFSSVYYTNKRLNVKFGCFWAVWKFDGWQLKNGKLQIWNEISIKEWSNKRDLTINSQKVSYCSRIHKINCRSLAIIEAKIFLIYVYSQGRTKYRSRSGNMVMTPFFSDDHCY